MKGTELVQSKCLRPSVTYLHEQKLTFTLAVKLEAEGYSSDFQPTAATDASFTAKSSDI